MTTEQPIKKTPISNFVMKICTQERFIELKRQLLCDNSDFEPYVAFQRLTRSGNSGITPSNIQRFLSENLIDMSLDSCRNLVSHYDADQDGLLSYKEFLEIVLPKEHPDLRAFVTQRECFEINEEEYLSYDTEVAIAVLLEREIALFEETFYEKEELDENNLNAHKVVELVDSKKDGNINFTNLQAYLNECGLMPYDSEIISFLRRVDRDDDGVILPDEMGRFMERFRTNERLGLRRKIYNPTNQGRLRTFSPGRPIVSNTISLIADRNIARDQPLKVKSQNVVENKSSAVGKKEVKKQEGDLKQSIIKHDLKASMGPSKQPAEKMKTQPSSRVFKKIENKKQTITVAYTQEGKKEEAGKVQQVQNAKPAVTNSYMRSSVKLNASGNSKPGNGYTHYVRARGNPPKATIHINKTGDKQRDSSIGQKPASMVQSRVINPMKGGVMSTREAPVKTENVQMSNTFRANTSNYEYPKRTAEVKESSPKEQVQKQAPAEVDQKKPVQDRSMLAYNRSRQRLSRGRRLSNSGTKSIEKRSNSKASSQKNNKLSQRKTTIPHAIPRADKPPSSRKRTQKEAPQAKPKTDNLDPSQPNQVLKTPIRIRDSKYKAPISKVVISKVSSPIENGTQNLQASQPPVQNYKPQENVQKQMTQSQVQHHPNQNASPIRQATRLPQAKQKIIRSKIPEGMSQSLLQQQSPQKTVKQTPHIPPLQQKPLQQQQKQQAVPKSQAMSPSQRKTQIAHAPQRQSQIKAQQQRQPQPVQQQQRRLETSKSPKTSPGYSRSFIQTPNPRPSKTLSSFVDVLANIIEEERLLEDSRRRLSVREDFDGKRLLSMIDRRSRGKFTFEEFRYFLGEVGVFHNDTRSLIDLYSSFDSNQNCLLGEKELLEMLMPKDQAFGAKLVGPPNPKYPALSNETKEMIATCFNRLFSLRKTITNSRRSLKDQNVDLNEVFDEVDRENKGYLERVDFENVITSVIPNFKESDLCEVGLFARKCDLDNDMKVNFKDFYIFFSL